MRKFQKHRQNLNRAMDKVEGRLSLVRRKVQGLFNGNVKLSRKRGPIAGVCQTLGEYFEVNPVFLRLGFVAGTIISLFIGLFLYALLVLLIPTEQRSVFEFGDPAFRQKPNEKGDPGVVDLVICESCNTAVIKKAKFCHHCGAFLGEVKSEVEL